MFLPKRNIFFLLYNKLLYIYIYIYIYICLYSKHYHDSPYIIFIRRVTNELKHHKLKVFSLESLSNEVSFLEY